MTQSPNPEMGNNFLSQALRESQLYRARILGDIRSLNSDPHTNLVAYRDLLVPVAPTVFETYGLEIRPEALDENGRQRLIFRDDRTDHVVFFAEVKVGDFMGRRKTEYISVVPYRPTGASAYTVLDSRQHTPEEMVKQIIKESGLGLVEGDVAGNQQKIAQIGDRADQALQIALLNDNPRGNSAKYIDLLAEAVTIYFARRFRPDVNIEKEEADRFIVISKEGIVLFVKVVIITGFTPRPYIAVNPIKPDGESTGLVIDSRDYSWDEMITRCMEEVYNPHRIYFETDDGV